MKLWVTRLRKTVVDDARASVIKPFLLVKMNLWFSDGTEMMSFQFSNF